jgi:outer membrane protein assembly factor BamD (BamD/ComL family)
MIPQVNTGLIGRFIKQLILLGIMLCGSFQVMAQSGRLSEARQYADSGSYDKALLLFRKMYAETPGDGELYHYYLRTLLAAKNYKDAEKLVQHQLDIRQQYPVLLVDLGHVYQLWGKEKKAIAQFDAALGYINGDDMRTQEIAKAFVLAGNDPYTILTFERARDILRNPFLYYSPLSKLYAKAGEIDKSVNTLLDGAVGDMGGIEDTKSTLLELLENDSRKIQLAQKALVKRINAQPENLYYAEMLTWLYTQKDDWDGALIQIRAIDERNRESGQRLLEFARSALRESRYETALKALDMIISKGADQALYTAARAEKLQVWMRRLEQDPTYGTMEMISKMGKEYDLFFTDYPQYNTTPVLFDYAKLEAQYHNDVEKGIRLLEQTVSQPAAARQFAGAAKLQLGDYYLLAGRIWDASLAYSQVDKAFREDVLGEEARFRNAKLAYYRGDFGWAQVQLSVLKASTSELIANDALYLSVLITENITPDSNYVPLERFAFADLLLFRNKDAVAESLLDSISKAFPQHPLNDDILLLRARLAEKHGDYFKALEYLKLIYTKFGQDVLGDDAVYKTAGIYEKYLKQKDQALHYYEQLILDYPGSTYVQSARQMMTRLNNKDALP